MGFNEATEAAADSQSLRILDQELREAKEELLAADQSLTKIVAKRKLSENKAKALQADIDTYSTHAIAAMEKGDEALALECADKVADLETSMAQENEMLTSFQKAEGTLKSNIAKAKNNVRRMEQQIDQIKATESVQKAQVAVSSRHMGANSKVKTALDSMERIKAKPKKPLSWKLQKKWPMRNPAVTWMPNYVRPGSSPVRRPQGKTNWHS